MSADRELDVWLAEHVMGYCMVKPDGEEWFEHAVESGATFPMAVVWAIDDLIVTSVDIYHKGHQLTGIDWSPTTDLRDTARVEARVAGIGLLMQYASALMDAVHKKQGQVWLWPEENGDYRLRLTNLYAAVTLPALERCRAIKAVVKAARKEPDTQKPEGG